MTYTDDPSQPPYMPPGMRPEPPRRKHPLRKWLIIASATFVGVIAAISIALAAIGTAAHNAANPVASHSAAPPPATANDTNAATEAASSPAPSGPDMLTVGQAETIGDSDNTTVGTVTVESVTITTRPADPSFEQGPANGYYVKVHIKATADPAYTQGWNVNELDFYALVKGSHVQPGNGNAYESLTDSQTNSDLTGTLAAGESSDGWLAFDVSSRHGKIVYAPNLDGQPVAEWSY